MSESRSAAPVASVVAEPPGAPIGFVEFVLLIAALMAAFIWTCVDNGLSGEQMRFAALPVTAIIGMLMFSRFFYTSFKGSRKDDRVPFWSLLILVMAMIGVALNPPVVLLVVFALYALLGPVTWLWRKITRKPLDVSIPVEHD